MFGTSKIITPKLCLATTQSKKRYIRIKPWLFNIWYRYRLNTSPRNTLSLHIKDKNCASHRCLCEIMTRPALIIAAANRIWTETEHWKTSLPRCPAGRCVGLLIYSKWPATAACCLILIPEDKMQLNLKILLSFKSDMSYNCFNLLT
jgi:hypothetical protein